MRRKKRQSLLAKWFVPHRGNDYKPVLFTAGGVALVLLILVVLEAGYLFDTRIIATKTNFLASVLPGVLATLTNDDRAANDIPPLTPDPLLAQAAQLKADDMAEKGYFAHVSPEGKTPWYWFDQVGYQYTYAGENLAVNFTDSKDVETAWMASPAHHANIVKAQYTRIGIGVAQGTYEGKQTTFVVQEFATPKAGSPQAAVAAAETQAAPAPASASGIVIQDAGSFSPTQVLGAETEPPAAAVTQRATSFFAQVATSPTHTLTYILAALASLLALLLLLAIGIHVRVQYKEVIGGGLLLILIALGLVVFNATNAPEPVVPGSGFQSSSSTAGAL